MVSDEVNSQNKFQHFHLNYFSIGPKTMLVNGKPRFINPISKRPVMVTCILFETVHNFYHMKSAIKYTSFFFKECKLKFLHNIILFLHKLLSRDLMSF